MNEQTLYEARLAAAEKVVAAAREATGYIVEYRHGRALRTLRAALAEWDALTTQGEARPPA